VHSIFWLGLHHEFLNAQLKEGDHFVSGFQCPLDQVMEEGTHWLAAATQKVRQQHVSLWTPAVQMSDVRLCLAMHSTGMSGVFGIVWRINCCSL